MSVNDVARRVTATHEIQQRASWTEASSGSRDETVLSMVSQLGGMAAAHARDDGPQLRMLAVRLAGDALAIVEHLDREAAR